MLSDDAVDSSFLGSVYKGIWNTTVLSFFSTTQVGNQLTNGHITDSWLGYNDELEKLGNSVLIESDTDVLNEPYSSRLRPLDDMTFLKRAKNLLIVNLSITCFDTTLHGSAHQSTTANNILKDSLNTDTPYPQTSFGNTIPLTWIRNYLNPIIKVNGTNILNSNTFNGFGTSNKGDQSIGWLQPKKINLYHLESSASSIEAFGSVRQILKTGSDYYAKAYPVKYEMVVTYQ